MKGIKIEVSLNLEALSDKNDVYFTQKLINSLQIYPMYGGGLNHNLNLEFMIGLPNEIEQVVSIKKIQMKEGTIKKLRDYEEFEEGDD